MVVSFLGGRSYFCKGIKEEKVREVPENNSLKKEIRRILELCKKDETDNGEGRNYLGEPIIEEEMTAWEEKCGAKIPESYKEWLRFS